MSHEKAFSRRDHLTATTEQGKIELTEQRLSDDELAVVAGGLNVKYTLFLPDGTPC